MRKLTCLLLILLMTMLRMNNGQPIDDYPRDYPKEGLPQDEIDALKEDSDFLTTMPSSDPDNEWISCNNLHDDDEKDVDNWGDMICTLINNEDEILISRETLTGGEANYSQTFDGISITKVQVLNIGRNHAFVSAIDITNEEDTSSHVEVYIEVPLPTKKLPRLLVEVYGVGLL